ncbi:Fe-S protein assembly co-chaperone HscB [Undibacterium sp.]|jgi:molecular chaperone HscB|uniref:Fe-S protein assembly co-chaperone HscB n=1 Tax=Undibacterium sp. TaxID=1914977 RepID=UPI002B8A0868|nr:Fe-S protein assembly co-chaperone HscB [Undibacterium sp.]HTD03348.1 Fe-S protein assembly co-chaperone HscB [Undibacterium sp.]
MQNHFDLFHLPQRYTLDLAQLDAAYREVQATVHPDKFVQAGDAEKRVAMQWATRANEAYQTLKRPLKRAAYLCEMHGVDVQSHSNTAMPAAFLMQQMEWREAFEDARHAGDVAALEALEADVHAALKSELHSAGRALDAGDYDQAAQTVRACMFLEKFIADIAVHAE